MSRGLRTLAAALLSGAMAAPPAASAQSPPAAPPAAEEPEAQHLRVDEQLFVVLREKLYFTDAIEARLRDHTSMAAETREAARRAGLAPDAAATEVRRVDGGAVRAALAGRVPADDDDAIRVLVRADLVRALAPLAGEAARSRESQAATLAAAKRLLRNHMSITGGDAIYGKVDTELARKVCSVVASRAPRPEKRPWCELAVWTLLAGGQAERASEMAAACERWIRDADAARARPPGDTQRPETPPATNAGSADLAAARALADQSCGRRAEAGEAESLLRQRTGSQASADPLRLQERVQRRLGHG